MGLGDDEGGCDVAAGAGRNLDHLNSLGHARERDRGPCLAIERLPGDARWVELVLVDLANDDERTSDVSNRCMSSTSPNVSLGVASVQSVPSVERHTRPACCGGGTEDAPASLS